MLADICVIAVVAFCVYRGYRSGLMKSFIKLLSYVISIIISFFLYPHVSEFLMKTPVYEKLAQIIGEKCITQGTSEAASNQSLGFFAEYVSKGIENVAAGIADSVAVLLINILAFIIILILSRFLIHIIGSIFNIFTKLPVVKQFNRLGGAVFGGIMGVVILYIISAIICFVVPLDSQSTISKQLDASVFAAEIYENNVILDFIGRGK